MTDNDQVIVELEHQLTNLSRRMLRGRRRGGQSLDGSAYLILSQLELDQPLSLKQLASALDNDVSTIHRQVAPLLRGGLVEYLLDPDGGRARKLRPTQPGVVRLQRDRAFRWWGVRHIVRDWDAHDRATLRDLLTRFNRGAVELEELSRHNAPGDAPPQTV